MKNIVICADGTGNAGRGTNVFKLYEAVDQTGHRLTPGLMPQVARYHDGVGTESLKWVRMLTGATGWGLSRNVKQLYGWLASLYAPGDRIFLFGFSRGAFTVRTLAGLIHACGILDLGKYSTSEAFEADVKNAYREYRRGYNSWLTAIFHKTKKLDADRLAELRSRFSVPIPEFQPDAQGKLIEFMGVWDTVDAVGLPLRATNFVNRVIYAFKFPDRTLNASVAHACHALALDEERESFAPVLWDESKTEDPKRIEQVWFAGVHSNVGGGYPRQGMSLVPFDWIMQKAEAPPHNLRFDPRLISRYVTDVNDKMYDSRAGLGVFYRWLPRDVQRLCADNRVTPQVHRSVFERIARNTDGYAPGSIPADPEVISLSQPPAMTDAIRKLVRDHHGSQGPLIGRATTYLRVGRWSYWLFVWGVLLTVFFMLKGFVMGPLEGTSTWGQVALDFTDTIVSSKWLGLTHKTLWPRPWLIAWLVVTLGLAIEADRQLDRGYWRFWHDDHMRLKLRKALGLG